MSDITTDGPHEITDARRWLARQLLDSMLSDAEVFGIVAHHPSVTDARPGDAASPSERAGSRSRNLASQAQRDETNE